jgi:hypothetical protein
MFVAFIFYGILILAPFLLVLKLLIIFLIKKVSILDKILLILAIILAIFTYFEIAKIELLFSLWFAVVVVVIAGIFLPTSHLKIALPLVIALIVIVFLLPLKNLIGPYLYLRQLDKTQAGEKIFSTVEHVEGYLVEYWSGCHDICQQHLLAKKCQYIEVDVASPNRNELTLESGYYRFYLEKKDSKKCELFKAYQKKWPSTSQQDKGKHCIASEKVEQLKSRYAARVNIYTKEVDYWNTHFKVRAIETFIINRQDQTVLAQIKTFSMPLFVQSFLPSELFKTYGSNEEHENLVYKVLKND